MGVGSWVWALIILLALSQPLEGKRKPTRSGRFVVLADLHFDSFYDPEQPSRLLCRVDDGMCRRHLGQVFDTFASVVTERNFAMGQYGCDAPDLLIGSVFHYVREMLVEEPDFIIVLGDWAAHCQHNTVSVLNLIETVTNKMDQAFPRATIIPVIGNNDMFPHNSMNPGPSKNLDYLAYLWSRWMSRPSVKEFKQAGFYSTSPVPGLRIVAMNTLFYYTKFCPFNVTEIVNTLCKEDAFHDTKEADPGGQFRWLENQLAQAAALKESVYVVSHIGPQVGSDYEDQWLPPYHKRFYEIISRYPDTVKALLFGHTHNDMMGLLNQPSPREADQGTMKTIFGNPGITTYDATNPAFRVFEYNVTTLELLDYENHFLDLNYVQTLDMDWSEASLAQYWEPQYSFTKTYQKDQLSDQNMNDIYYRMHDNLLLAKQYTFLMRNMAHYPPQAPKTAACSIYRNETLCNAE